MSIDDAPAEGTRAPILAGIARDDLALRSLARHPPLAASPRARIVHWLRILGPGVITGAADDDPSGISTYSVAGATTGFTMLWVALITTPMTAVVQGMCARIGMTTGKGLAGVIRSTFPLWLAIPLAVLVVVANTFNIAADLAGMAASAQLVLGLPMMFWISFFGVVLAVAPIMLSYGRIASVAKWLALSLFAYVITAFLVHPNWLEIAGQTLIPHVRLTREWMTTFLGFMGTTITPYLFFWQASQMVEDEKRLGRARLKQRLGATAQEIRDAHLDVNTGMIFSNAVTFFIVVTTAVTLGARGITHIDTAQQAALALRPLAGPYAYLLFMFGMIGTGMLAIPILAGSSAYVLAETFGMSEGLNERFRSAAGFYSIIVVSTLVGVAFNISGFDPIKALYWSAVFNGLAAVPLLIVITLIANRVSVVGRWTNSLAANGWSVLAILFMTAGAIGLFVL